MIVGTAGHVDHGKTSLVKALTGVDADRLKEEKERGITIDLGFVYWPMADGRVIGFVDVPGHERFVRTMVAGVQAIDLVLLVVAADDGVMPQTCEHLEIIDLLGHRRGVVALTKIDAVSAARVTEAAAEIEAALAGTGLAGSPVIPVSSRTGEGIDLLAAALSDHHRSHVPRRSGRLFRLLVDRCFLLQGAGVVVTGAVADGVIRVGDEVVVSPSGRAARVRSIHAQSRKAEQGVAGERCALNLVGADIRKDAIRRGDVVTLREGHAPTDRVDALVGVARSERTGLTSWMPVRMHCGVSEVGGRIVPLSDAPPGPGDAAFVQIVLEQPIAARAHDRFVLRDVSASRTLGGGRLIDLRAPARRRRSEERLALLGAMAEEDAVRALEAMLSVSAAPVNLAGFARDRGVVPATVGDWLRDAGGESIQAPGGPFGMAADRIDALAEQVRSALATFHVDHPDLPGMGVERLRLATARSFPAEPFRALLQRFAGEGKLALNGAWIGLASHRMEMSPEVRTVWREIRPRLGGSARFRPPRVRDLAGSLRVDVELVRKALRRAARAGEVDEAAHDHFFLRQALAEAVAIGAMAETEAGGLFPASAFRNALEARSGEAVGRKVAIQILEFLDAHGVTIRRGDLRRINPHRRDLFSVQSATTDQAELTT